MRNLLSSASLAFSTLLSAQQADWLESWPVDYALNPAFGTHLLAQGTGGELLSMRQVSGAFVYGQDLFGQVAVERLDPATGAVLWSCGLADSATVEAATVGPDGTCYVAGQFMGGLATCNGALANTGTHWDMDYFLLAFAADGTPLWMRNVSQDHPDMSALRALAVDPSGSLWYALGGYDQAQLIRVDGLGQDVETRVIEGFTLIGSMDFDPWGGLYVSGATDENGLTFGGRTYELEWTGGYRMFVLRYDPAGDAGFARFAHDVTFNRPTVVDDGAGHAYLAGTLMDTTSWGGLLFNGPDWVYATFLAKVDSTGEFLWGRESDPAGGVLEGDLARAKGPCIAVDGARNVYLLGDTRGLVRWSDEVVSGVGTAPQGCTTIVAFAPDGQPLWAANSDDGGAASGIAQTLTADATGVLHFSVHTTGPFGFAPLLTNGNGAQAAVVGELNGLSTGVADVVTADGLACWPNPAREALHIRCDGRAPLDALLFDNAGACVRAWRLARGVTTVRTADVAPGLYLLRLADGRSFRWVKE